MDSLIFDITPFHFVVYALAVFRLAILFSLEKGPWGMFAKMRRSVPKRSTLKEGIECPLCVSVWFASIITPYIVLKHSWSEMPQWVSLSGDSFLVALAMSAVAVIIHMHTTKSL